MIDYTTPRGQVRLITADTDESNFYLTDAQLDGFLGLEAGNVKRAAAQALDCIASNEALVQKRITILDLATDGPAVAASLRAHAASLRSQANDADTAGGGDWDVIDTVIHPAYWVEYI